MIRHFAKNTVGKDYVVGDIHGCFSKLQVSLDGICFNPEVDRLFSVGDLVDRGPESELVTEWIAKPWFFAVRGNHDDFAIHHALVGNLDFDSYTKNGGLWFMALPKDEQLTIADALAALPYAISVETDSGLVGVVHADIPFNDWQNLVSVLSAPLDNMRARVMFNMVAQHLMWSRDRAESGFKGIIKGIAHLVVGHSSVTTPGQLGNVIYIDTMGWRDGEFTLAKIQG